MTGTNVGRARSDPAAIIRSVSSVTFGIDGADAFERTVRASASWMRARNPGLPVDAGDGRPFDVGGGGSPVARAVSLEIKNGRIWSAAIDDPDRTVFSRTWITEITVVEQDGAVHFGTRLLNFSRGEDQPFDPSIPRLVRDIVVELPCYADGELLRDAAKIVTSPKNIEELYALLENSNRRLPVIVLAQGVSRQPFASLETLTRRLAGAAHVFGITDECTWELKRRVGKDLAVFDGAVRMYRPGLRFDEADPYHHPLWLAAPGLPSGNGRAVIARVLAAGTAKGTTYYPRFEAVRQAAIEQAISVRRPDTSAVEIAESFEQQNAALRDQLASLRDEQNQWLHDAETERSSSEQQIAELRAEIHRHRAQNEMLRGALKAGTAHLQRTPLTDFSNFAAWAEANISTNIWLSPKAIKAAERTGQYREPSEVGEALFALDDIYVPMRLQPGDAAHQLWQERTTQLGLTLSPCFTRDGDLQRFPEYSVQYRGERKWCDLHLKHGGGTDPKGMFRIYFHWDEEEGMLLIGHLPSHLDNNMTH